MVSWAVDENAGYELTGETVFGLTSTNSQGRSVISYVGFTSNLKTLQQELNDAVGIHDVRSERTHNEKTIYSPDGIRQQHLSQGVNIVVDNGKVSKIYK